MRVHKFGIKITKLASMPLTIQWKPMMNQQFNPEKRSPRTWQIFCQARIVIKPKEVKTISLAFGVEMSDGMIHISLNQELKLKRCINLDGSVVEGVENILATIQNNSENNVIILPGETLCLIRYMV